MILKCEFDIHNVHGSLKRAVEGQTTPRRPTPPFILRPTLRDAVRLMPMQLRTKPTNLMQHDGNRKCIHQ